MSQIASNHTSLGIESLEQVHRCIEVGLNCVETDQERRPSASQILLRIQDTWQAIRRGVLAVTVTSGAEDLPAKDMNGKSDPYVILYDEKKSKQTRVILYKYKLLSDVCAYLKV